MADSIGGYPVIATISNRGRYAVYHVYDPSEHRDLAIKTPSPGTNPPHRIVDELHREGTILLSLSHPNVVQAYKLAGEGRRLMMVMEYIPGRAIRRMLKNPKYSAKLNLGELLIQLASALAHVHDRGIVHRDVKPANILVTPEGRLSLIDFSVACQPAGRWANLFTRKLRISGTHSYLPPESLEKRGFDFRADIYSLGVTMYELLTGQLPFTAESEKELLLSTLTRSIRPIRELNTKVTIEAEDLIMRMMEKNPEQRPSNADVVKERLKQIRLFVPDE